MRIFQLFTLCVFIISCTTCVTSPTGRRQFIIVSDDAVDKMGIEAFRELRRSEKLSSNARDIAYLRCIIDPMIRTLDTEESNPASWELALFQNNDANAFALPGRKIGVYTGLLNVAKTQGELAAVLGHEIGHALARHAAERLSQQAGTKAGLAALGSITGDSGNRDLLLGILGVGAQVGILLPFSRAQESEADTIGIELMAKAGFDPEESITLWRNIMAASRGRAPPEWLSTHPAGQTRISQLEQDMPKAKELYQRARSQGKAPRCAR